MLDIIRRCLQVYCEGKIACFILFVFFFVYKEGDLG